MQTAFEFEMKMPSGNAPLQRESVERMHTAPPTPLYFPWLSPVLAAPCGNFSTDMTTLRGICVHWHFVCKHYSPTLPLHLSHVCVCAPSLAWCVCK